MSFDETTFFVEPNSDPQDRIQVEVGDSKQPKFEPQTKIMRFDNEANLSARLIHDEPAPVVYQEGDTIVWEGEKVKAEFYEIKASEDLPDGASEIEITLLEKPSTNVVRFSLNTKGLAFHYQDPALCAELIASGGIVPENVFGSYAVYFDEPKVNLEGGQLYRSGKFGHIYRPRIEDSAGNSVWGDLHVDGPNNEMRVTIPQDFLDNAVYPVRHAAGATFGYTSIGASLDGSSLNDVHTVRATPSAGTVTSINFYSKKFQEPSTNFKPALWKASDRTVVSNSVGPAVLVNSSTAQWWTSTYTTSPNVTAQEYHVGWVNDADGAFIYVDFVSGAGDVVTGNSYASPTTLGTAGATNRRHSVYATYTLASQNYTLTVGGSVTATGNAIRGAAGIKGGSVTGSTLVSRAASGFKAGAVACAAIISKAASRTLSKASIANSAAARQGQRQLSRSSTSSTVIRRSTSYRLSSSTTPAAAAIRKASVSKSGSLTPQGVAIRAALLSFAGSVSPNGVIAKLANRLLGGSVTAEGEFTSLMVTIFALFASVTPSAEITQITRGRILTASVSANTSIAKSAQHFLASSVTAIGTAITVATYIFVHYLTASVTAAGTTTRDASATKAANVTASGVGVRSAMRALSAALTPAAIAVRLAARREASSVTPAATIGVISVFLLDIAASVTASATKRISSVKSFVRTVIASGKDNRVAQRSQSGSVTPAAVYQRTGIVHPMRSVTASSIMLRALNKFAFALVLPTGKAGRLAQRYEHSTVVPVALASRFGALILNLTASVAPEGWIFRSSEKRVTANVPAAGFVLGLADRYLASEVNAETEVAASKYTPYSLAADVTPTTATRKAVTKYTARVVAPIGQAIRKASRWLSGAVTAVAQLFGFSRKGVIRMRTDVFLTTRINTRIYVK